MSTSIDQIKTTLDVLNPIFKGKIIVQDPGVPGNGNDWFSHTIANILGMERGEKFMHELLKLDPTVVRDSRQITEGRFFVRTIGQLPGIGDELPPDLDFGLGEGPVDDGRGLVTVRIFVIPPTDVIGEFEEVAADERILSGDRTF